MGRVPFQISESELAGLLSSAAGAGGNTTENAAQWQARLMLYAGELLDICREAAEAKCLYFGNGHYLLSINQDTRRRARALLQQLERRSTGRSESVPSSTVSLTALP
jgi:hypothetical protein